MTESSSTTTDFDTVLCCQTSRYTHRMTLLLALLVGAIILAIQFPIFIYSPDGSFHAAKILRASEGDYFTDPFTGIATVYPSLFHLFYGLINRAVGLNPIQIVQFITLVDFFALFAAFYYCAAALLKNAEEVSLCVLSLALVTNEPTSHYIIAAQPSSFSFVFLFLSIGALYRYVIHYKVRYLMLFGVLGSLAVNIWWTNVVSIFAVITVLTYYMFRYGKPPALSHVAILLFSSLIPCFYTAWHFYCIRDILPYYLSDPSREGDVSFFDALITSVVTFLTKGNLQFMHHLNFWGPSGIVSSTSNLLSGGMQRVHAMISAVHYFAVVMPFNLFLVAYSAWVLLRKEWPIPRLGLFRTLAIGGFAVLFCSSVLPFVMDVGKLRRVHFTVFILFLLFCFTTAPALIPADKLQKLWRVISIAAIFALAYTVVYSPRLFTSSLSPYDSEVVQFVRSIEGREHQRILMLGEGLHRVAPFVTLQSFVEAFKGRYYHQDPHTASELYRDLTILKKKTDEWKNVVRERNVKWVILRTSEVAESEVFKQYENDGILRYKNRDWAILELTFNAAAQKE